MYSLPSMSYSREPCPRAMNGGVPPTPRNARTGEFTPPGISFWAQANNSSDRERFIHPLLRPSLLRNDMLQEHIHEYFQHGAVEILEQSALQVKIRLGAGEEVFNQRLEPRAAANKIDHARRDGAE